MSQPTTSWARRPQRFRDVDESTWADWRWQQRSRMRAPEDFDGVLVLTDEERDCWASAAAQFRIAVTPHYAALMDATDPACPIRRQALPHPDELIVRPFELRDPLAEDRHAVSTALTHRYPDRVLLYATHNCPVYCRHCTRKRKVAEPTSASTRDELSEAIAYIARTPAVRDVVISGGDPLSLSDERLDALLGRLRAIEHVDVIRVGTRNPVTLPQRITGGLADVFHAHRPIYVNTHFNHPNEIGGDALGALEQLRDAGCILGNQMVLLRGINDDPEVVMSLNRALLRAGCRPYYMLQCDMAEGISHFRTPLQTGLDIMQHLRGRLSGLGIPDFVVDLPNGGGKVELTPDSIVSREGTQIEFESAAGRRRFMDFAG